MNSDFYADTLAARKFKSKIFSLSVALCAFACVVILFFLIAESFLQGHEYLTWDFLQNFPSRFPSKAGLKAALFGSLYIIAISSVLTLFVGVGTAIYLEEIANKDSRISRLIELNIANLAGVPSLVYGILGLALFARQLNFGNSVMTAALTLSLMILPTLIISSREALRSVPQSIRQAALALGATPWQAVVAHVLPAATPGILTGLILGISRAIGEAAPLILVGGLVFVTYTPENIWDSFTVLPIQIFNWASRPQEEFQNLAAAGIIVLLAVLLTLNSIAIVIRNRYEKFQRW